MDEPASSYASQSRTWLCPNRQLTNILANSGKTMGKDAGQCNFRTLLVSPGQSQTHNPNKANPAEITKAHGSLVAASLFFVRLGCY